MMSGLRLPQKRGAFPRYVCVNRPGMMTEANNGKKR